MKELKNNAPSLAAFFHTSALWLSENKHLQEAAPVFQKALQAHAFLAETSPDNNSYLNSCASTHEALREHHVRTGDKAAAEQALRSAILIREKILKALPDEAGSLDKLAWDNLRLGDQRKGAGQKAEALPLYEQSLRTWTRLAELRADNPDVIGRQCNAREKIAGMLIETQSPDALARATQLLKEGEQALKQLDARGQLNEERRNWLAAITRAQARL